MIYYCLTCRELNLDIEVDLEVEVYGSVDPHVIVTGVYGESGNNLLRSDCPYLRTIAETILVHAESDDDFKARAIREMRSRVREDV